MQSDTLHLIERLGDRVMVVTEQVCCGTSQSARAQNTVGVGSAVGEEGVLLQAASANDKDILDRVALSVKHLAPGQAPDAAQVAGFNLIKKLSVEFVGIPCEMVSRHSGVAPLHCPYRQFVMPGRHYSRGGDGRQTEPHAARSGGAGKGGDMACIRVPLGVFWVTRADPLILERIPFWARTSP